MRKSFATLSFITVCATLSACQTMTPEMQQHHRHTQQKLAERPVALLADACLARVELGKDDILYQQSNAAAQAINQTLTSALHQQGVKISHSVAPFVCGFMPKEKTLKADIRMTEDAKDVPNTTYPLLSSNNVDKNTNSPTNKAYLTLLTHLDNNTLKSQARKISTGDKLALGLAANTRSQLIKALGSDKVFVSTVTGSKPSFTAAMTLGAITALASSGTYVSSLQKGQYYDVYLLDLQDDQVLWYGSGTVPGQVFKSPYSTEYAIPKLLSPIY